MTRYNEVGAPEEAPTDLDQTATTADPEITTTADVLIAAHPGGRYLGERAMDRFRRLAVDSEGAFWTFVLDAEPGDLDPDAASYVSRMWASFVRGERPFRKGRRGRP